MGANSIWVWFKFFYAYSITFCHCFLFGGGQKEILVWEKNIYWLLSCTCPEQGLNLQPLFVPDWELNLQHLYLWYSTPVNWATQSRAAYSVFSILSESRISLLSFTLLKCSMWYVWSYKKCYNYFYWYVVCPKK